MARAALVRTARNADIDAQLASAHRLLGLARTDAASWLDVQPVAQTATAAQLPALAAAATPLQSGPDATEVSSAEPWPLLAAAATAAPTDGAQDTATATELAPAQTPPPLPVAAVAATPIGAAATAGSAAAQLESQRRFSSRSKRARNIDEETPAWAARQRDDEYRQRRWQQRTGGNGSVCPHALPFATAAAPLAFARRCAAAMHALACVHLRYTLHPLTATTHNRRG